MVLKANVFMEGLGVEKNKSILIIGGDDRQKQIYNSLNQTGKNCARLYSSLDFEKADEAIKNADIVILPLPVTKDKKYIYTSNVKRLSVEKLKKTISSSALVLGGMISSELKIFFDENKIKYYDYYGDESLLIYNAALTSQAAVKIILENLTDILGKSRVLITGFGRIGKSLALLLKALGFKVYVAARSKSQRTLAQSMGLSAMDINEISFCIYLFDFIVNTVPSRVFKNEYISKMKDSAYFIELSSKPYGADPDEFENEKKNYILASSLPGKYYPCASAEIILKAIEKFL